jgi:large subunit ribosomal protein L5
MAKLWTRKESIMTTRLETFYKDQVMKKLTERFGYQNVMQIPRITKITLNMGVGEAAGNKKVLENAVADMAKISGQKPIQTKARVSVASFKIRDGWPIGCKVTLRRAQMWEFLDRLINISLPRTRDFRGVSGRAFDGRGNYNFGIKEQIIFPEIDFDAVDAMRGMDISITTTAKSDEEAKALLEAFSFPFRN